jgi:RNA polymerase sigma factor (sigma-70 family)
MRQSPDAYLFPGVFAPVLSLDVLTTPDENGVTPFDITDPASGQEDQFANHQALDAVARFVASLSARDQDIVRSVFWDGQSQTEVAARLKVSKMAISKAMARIFRLGRIALSVHQSPPSIN